MPKGGARKGAGRKKTKPEVSAPVQRTIATEVLDSLALEWKHKAECKCEICSWRTLILEAGDCRIRLEAMKYLTDKRDGKAVHTVNHLHDKPLDVNVNHTVSERMLLALEKAEARVRNR